MGGELKQAAMVSVLVHALVFGALAVAVSVSMQRLASPAKPADLLELVEVAEAPSGPVPAAKPATPVRAVEPAAEPPRLLAESVPANPSAPDPAPVPAPPPQPVPVAVSLPLPEVAPRVPPTDSVESRPAAMSLAAAATNNRPITPGRSSGRPLAVRTVAASPSPAADPVGDGSNLVTSAPEYRRNPPAVYPVAARRRRQEGTVLLQVTVDARGRAARVAVKSSSGISAFDTAAREAVERWEFTPARRGGEPVAAEIEVPIRFKLSE